MKHFEAALQVINPTRQGLVNHRKRVLRSQQRCWHEAQTATVEGMLLSLEISNAEALTVVIVGAISNQRKRRVGEIRPGSKNISKAEKGSTGTRESLTSPHEKRTYGLSESKQSRLIEYMQPFSKAQRKELHRKWYQSRGKPKTMRRTKAVLVSSYYRRKVGNQLHESH